MKDKKLHEQTGQTSNNPITEANSITKRKRPWVKWLAIAACLVLAAFIVIKVFPENPIETETELEQDDLPIFASETEQSDLPILAIPEDSGDRNRLRHQLPTSTNILVSCGQARRTETCERVAKDP